MKVLCICNHGNVRSVALRKEIWRLNGSGKDMTPENIKHEAIAVGLHSTSSQTLSMLLQWADLVVDLSDGRDELKSILKLVLNKKYVEYPIGPDIWKDPLHPDLIKIVKKIVKEII